MSYLIRLISMVDLLSSQQLLHTCSRWFIVNGGKIVITTLCWDRKCDTELQLPWPSKAVTWWSLWRPLVHNKTAGVSKTQGICCCTARGFSHPFEWHACNGWQPQQNFYDEHNHCLGSLVTQPNPIMKIACISGM